jgi:hypothetical protein
MSTYSLVDFDEWKRQYGLKRSVVIRHRIARKLVRLASRIDRRPYVKYVIEHHRPKGL